MKRTIHAFTGYDGHSASAAKCNAFSIFDSNFSERQGQATAHSAKLSAPVHALVDNFKTFNTQYVEATVRAD